MKTHATGSSTRLRPWMIGVMLLLCLPAADLAARVVYRSVDENGVVSFSDVRTERAEPVELPVVVVREGAAGEQQALMEQQLAVARSLEESRLAREEARTRRIEALAAARPRTVYHREADRQRYVGGFWGYWPGYPGYPGYPGDPSQPSLPVEPPVPGAPPSRPVPLPPLK